MTEKRNLGLAILVVTAFALSRWPDAMPYGISAAYGVVLCCGAFSRRFPWWLAFAVILVTDVLKNLYQYHVDAVSSFMLGNYVAYGLVFLLGRWLTAKASLLKLTLGGMLGAILFYLVTNTAAWITLPDYAKTLAGWFQAVTVGLTGWPETWKFFGRTVLGSGLFTALIAAAFKFSEKEAPEPEEEEQEAPASETEEAKS